MRSFPSAARISDVGWAIPPNRRTCCAARSSDEAAESDGSGADWISWFRHVGVHYPGLDEGPRFNQAILALEAAASGLGVALAPKSLVAADLESGRLVRLSAEETPTVFSYYIVCLPERVERGSTAIFIEWLRREAGF